jgi:ABC-type dipeptide/oligopeptide/nickel transport system ATPase component
MSILFITHNLGLVARLASQLVVMQKGKIVESSSVNEFFKNPKMEYSKSLLEAVPKLPTQKN